MLAAPLRAVKLATLQSLRRPAVILLNQRGKLSLAAAWPPEDSLDPATWNAAELAFTRNEPVGFDSDLLHDSNVKVTRLAHGVPVGGELDYLDEGTLAAAIRQRTPF